MIFSFGPISKIIDWHDLQSVKQFIEEYPGYDVTMSQEDIDSIHNFIRIDVEFLQIRWGLLLYIETYKHIKTEYYIRDLVMLYSLEEEEYNIFDDDPAKCEPITNLFRESGVYPLTDVEVEIIKRSTFQFDPEFNRYIEHLDENSKYIIRNKRIDRKWKLFSMRQARVEF